MSERIVPEHFPEKVLHILPHGMTVLNVGHLVKYDDSSQRIVVQRNGEKDQRSHRSADERYFNLAGIQNQKSSPGETMFSGTFQSSKRPPLLEKRSRKPEKTCSGHDGRDSAQEAKEPKKFRRR